MKMFIFITRSEDNYSLIHSLVNLLWILSSDRTMDAAASQSDKLTDVKNPTDIQLAYQNKTVDSKRNILGEKETNSYQSKNLLLL